MSPELLRLHISQLRRTIARSKTNQYDDNIKREYHNNLIKLLEEIQNLDLSNCNYQTQIVLKETLNFIFYSIEFLDSSTLTNIPHEIVFCLEKALKDWVKTNEYIIVTSLHNNIDSYSFNDRLALHPIYFDIIKALFNIEFSHRLIQINLPKYLVHDYLANVILYHELGHFIDLKYKISERLAMIKVSSGGIDKDKSKKYENHISEFFADIFAAQYVGEASNYYLNYIAHKNGTSLTHPSTDSRISIVEDFLNEKNDNRDLNDIMEATRLTTNNELKNRFLKINEKDFIDFVPLEIKNVSELHSIFGVGWELWKKEIKQFKDRNIDDIEKYQIINNLIEKTISNYMVLEKWNK